MSVNITIPDRFSEGQIAIRRFRREDAEELVTAVRESAEELPRWIPDLNPGITVESTRSWMDYSENSWAEGTRYDFAIIDAHDGALLGGCGLSNISRAHRLANLFYWVRSSCTGRGAATAAAKLLARFGFEHAGLLRVEIVVAVGNGASLHVAEKTGAQHEGLLRNRLQMHGKQYDAHMFSLIPSDFE